MSVTTVARAPRLSIAEAGELARTYFGIEGHVTELPSERDQNFRIDRAPGDAVVLKVANADEDPAVLDLQTAALQHVAARVPGAAICPRVVPARMGADRVVHAAADGRSHVVRMLSYLPGKPLALVKPHDLPLLQSVGALVGRLTAALVDFDHAAAHRTFHWDLARGAEIVARDSQQLPAERQPVVARYLQRVRDHVLPRLERLRMSVIHGDGNDYNVLVTYDDDWSGRASGVIDFGDMVYSHLVNDAAIAGAYAMLGKEDPLAAAAAVVAGFHHELPLSEDEIDVVFDLMCLRLCVSVCLAAEQTAAAPENGYLLISQAPIWQLFDRLADIHPDFARYTIRAACGLAPCPQEEPVMAWIEAHVGTFAPVVLTNLRGPAPLMLDLSVGSPALDGTMLGDDSLPLAELIFGSMGAAGAQVAIGRYGEARLLYRAEQFAATTDALPTRRTAHLGVDLFMAPGSTVCTPLAGTVHSVQNNRGAQDYGPTVILRHVTDDGTPFYTLYGHLALDTLTRLQPGQQLKPGHLVGTLGDALVNGGWPPHLHFQLIVDNLDLTGNFPGVARPDQQAVWQSISPDPSRLLGLSTSAAVTPALDQTELLRMRRRHLGPNLSISYRRPLTIVRGWQQYLYDDRGLAYLDGVNNVCHVGHCHPRVVAAGQEQMAVLNTNTRYLHPNLTAYATRLLAKFPPPLDTVFFVCSGSEANELALRLARTYTARRDIIMLDAAYHGNTQALVDISPYKHAGPGGQGAPEWAHTARMPDPYRGLYKGYAAATGDAYAGHVQDLVGQLTATGRPPAAFIAESVLGCGGQIVLPDGYLRAAFEYVRAAGGVCIADEVQVGFGRVGSHFWGWETQAVVPDIVTMGKPIGNGHPLAAVVTTRAIADAFANGMEYFNTFGGNPVSCAIGLAVLDVIEQEGLQEHARVVGDRLLTGLGELGTRYPLIGDVRGLGLFVGAELVLDHDTLAPAPDHASYIANRMRDHGILMSTDGPLHNVLKLKPPLVFSGADADRLVATLEIVLQHDCLQV